MALEYYNSSENDSYLFRLSKCLLENGDNRTLNDYFDSLNAALKVFAPKAKCFHAIWCVPKTRISAMCKNVMMQGNSVYAYRIPIPGDCKFDVYGYRAADDDQPGVYWMSVVYKDGHGNPALYECSVMDDDAIKRNIDPTDVKPIGELLNSAKKEVESNE